MNNDYCCLLSRSIVHLAKKAITIPPTITTGMIIYRFQPVLDSDSSDADGVVDSSGAGSGVVGDSGSEEEGAGVGASSESESGSVEGGVSGGADSTCGTRMAKVVKWLTEAVIVWFTVSTSESNSTHSPMELS